MKKIVFALMFVVLFIGFSSAISISNDYWMDLSSVDTGNWLGTNTTLDMVIDNTTNLVYIGASGGKFGVYNRTSNVLTDLSTTDAGNWIGLGDINALAIDNTNKLIYIGTSKSGVTGDFGVYNITSGSSVSLNNTDTSPIDYWADGTYVSVIYDIAYDFNNDLVYTAHGSLGTSTGQFGVYNRTSGVWTRLSTTDTGDWASSRFVTSLTYNFNNDLVYTGLATNNFGVYNRTSNVWTDLSDTDTSGWAYETSNNYVWTMDYDGTNDLVYTGLIQSGTSLGFFGVYNRTSNVWTNLTNTNTSAWGTTKNMYRVIYDNDNDVVYTSTGYFGVYNRTSNVWTGLTDTDGGNWVGTVNLRSLSYDSINREVYTGLTSGKFGVYREFNTSAMTTPFISIWNTSKTSTGSSNSTTIVLPLESSGTYSFEIDWGDGTSEYSNSYLTNHTYASEGNYTLKIDGIINGFRFMGTGDRLKIINITQWGDLRLINNVGMGGIFEDCSNLDIGASDVLNLNGVTDLSFMFAGTNVTTIPNINLWDTSKITDMSFMFANAYNFNGNVTTWDISNVTTIANMFASARAFNQNLTLWNTSKVTVMSSTFRDARVFNGNISNWDTSKATTMSRMFEDAYVFNQDISSWDVSNVTLMTNMFNDAWAFNQNLTNWNTSKVSGLGMNGMFYKAYAFNGNISNWDTSNVTSMNYMFAYANSFAQDVKNWNTSKVDNMDSMFRNVTLFTSNISNWNISALVSASNMFGEVTLTTDLYDSLLNSWANQTPNIKNSVVFSGGNSKYSLVGNNSRNGTLIGTHLWSITDGGFLPTGVEVTIILPENIQYSYNESLPLNYTYTNITAPISSCWYKVVNSTGSVEINNVSLTSCTNSTFNVSRDDTYILTLYVNDTDGTIGQDSVQFVINTEYPNIVLDYPTTNTYFNTTQNIYFNFTATDKDGVSTCDLYSNFTGSWALNETFIGIINGTQNYTTKNLSEGYYKWNVWCNDSTDVGGFSITNKTLTVDTTAPTMNNLTITTTAGLSQILFISNITDTNMGTCKYAFWEDQVTPADTNYSYSCNTLVSRTAPGFGTYYLFMYSTDLAGNENSQNLSFSTASSTIITGGGGTTTVTISNATGWTMLTPFGTTTYEINAIQGLQVTKGITFENTGITDRTITISCLGDFCETIEFSEVIITLIPGEEKTITFKMTIPEGTINADYSTQIIGLDDISGGQYILVKTKVSDSIINTIVAKIQGYKWGIPYWLLLIFAFIIAFFISEMIFIKAKFRSLISFLIAFVSPALVLLFI